MALHPPRSTLGAGSAVLLAALLAVGCERRLTPPADRGLAPSQSPSTSLSEEDSPSMTDAEQPAKGEASANLERIERTDAEWRKLLDPEAYRILRQSGTERPFSGIYEHDTRPGTFACKGCGLPLFRSDAKFDAGCGWPSFFEPLDGAHLESVRDTSHGMVRIEVRCKRCGGHLGHVFPDGPKPTGLRYCINSVAIVHEADAKKDAPAASEGGTSPAQDDAK